MFTVIDGWMHTRRQRTSTHLVAVGENMRIYILVAVTTTTTTTRNANGTSTSIHMDNNIVWMMWWIHVREGRALFKLQE